METPEYWLEATRYLTMVYLAEHKKAAQQKLEDSEAASRRPYPTLRD